MNGWTHLHSCSLAAELTDISPVSGLEHLPVLWHKRRVHYTLAFDRTLCKNTTSQKHLNCCFIPKITTTMLMKWGNLLGSNRQLTNFGSCCSGEQLVGKPIADARRQAHLTASLPSISTHTPFNKCRPFILKLDVIALCHFAVVSRSRQRCTQAHSSFSISRYWCCFNEVPSTPP